MQTSYDNNILNDLVHLNGVWVTTSETDLLTPIYRPLFLFNIHTY